MFVACVSHLPSMNSMFISISMFILILTLISTFIHLLICFFISLPSLLHFLLSLLIQGYPQAAPILNPTSHPPHTQHQEKGGQVGMFWPPWVVRRVLDDTLRGLVYLHSHEPPIIHRGVCMCEYYHYY